MKGDRFPFNPTCSCNFDYRNIWCIFISVITKIFLFFFFNSKYLQNILTRQFLENISEGSIAPQPFQKWLALCPCWLEVSKSTVFHQNRLCKWKYFNILHTNDLDKPSGEHWNSFLAIGPWQLLLHKMTAWLLATYCIKEKEKRADEPIATNKTKKSPEG